MGRMIGSLTCDSCKFFEKHKNISDGYCKRFPPVVIVALIGDPPQPRMVSATPNMDADDWCGEFIKKIVLH